LSGCFRVRTRGQATLWPLSHHQGGAPAPIRSWLLPLTGSCQSTPIHPLMVLQREMVEVASSDSRVLIHCPWAVNQQIPMLPKQRSFQAFNASQLPYIGMGSSRRPAAASSDADTLVRRSTRSTLNASVLAKTRAAPGTPDRPFLLPTELIRVSATPIGSFWKM